VNGWRAIFCGLALQLSMQGGEGGRARAALADRCLLRVWEIQC